MTLSGKVNERDWSVSVETCLAPGGFECLIHVAHSGPTGMFEHQFKHFKLFRTEPEAVLDGLREGMLWIEHKMSNAFSL
jgi:hypothetical protein